MRPSRRTGAGIPAIARRAPQHYLFRASRIASGPVATDVSSSPLPSWSDPADLGRSHPDIQSGKLFHGWPPLALAARPHVKASRVLSNSKTGFPTNTRCELPTL